jgi:hypothetical protein
MKSLIILAKVEMTGARQTGKMVKRDMNWFPEVEAAPEARALIYSSDVGDLEKAKAYAAQEGWNCWVMPDSDDVLKQAREKALSVLANNAILKPHEK